MGSLPTSVIERNEIVKRSEKIEIETWFIEIKMKKLYNNPFRFKNRPYL